MKQALQEVSVVQSEYSYYSEEEGGESEELDDDDEVAPSAVAPKTRPMVTPMSFKGKDSAASARPKPKEEKDKKSKGDDKAKDEPRSKKDQKEKGDKRPPLPRSPKKSAEKRPPDEEDDDRPPIARKSALRTPSISSKTGLAPGAVANFTQALILQRLQEIEQLEAARALLPRDHQGRAALAETIEFKREEIEKIKDERKKGCA